MPGRTLCDVDRLILCFAFVMFRGVFLDPSVKLKTPCFPAFSSGRLAQESASQVFLAFVKQFA
jgi:hypothetical protein